jgi:hypothetical protein
MKKFQLRRAERSKAKLRVGLAGPSGSGKTYSALLMAHGICADWEKIVVIDTERQSADLYSEMGPYNVITLEAPFEPQQYIDAIKYAESEGMEVIIVDSITHEWGEAKNMVDKLGGRFQDWAKVTPIHDRFVDSIVSSKCHIITTVRSKTDYAMTTEGGKTKVQKVGLKAETRDGFEYELTVSFDLNINHLAETSKDRTGLFMDADPFVISQETGQKLAEWAGSGTDFVKRVEELLIQKGKDVTPIIGHYKVTSLAMLNIDQFKKVISQLESMPDALDKEAHPEVKKNDDKGGPDTDAGTKEPEPQQESSEADKIADEVDAGLKAQEEAKKSQPETTVADITEALGAEPEQDQAIEKAVDQATATK